MTLRWETKDGCSGSSPSYVPARSSSFSGRGGSSLGASRRAWPASAAAAAVVLDGDVEKNLERFVRLVTAAGPVLTDIALYWEGAAMSDLEAGAPRTTRIPDLYGGEAVRVLGRFGGSGATRLVITALTADGRPFRQELAVTLPEEQLDVRGLGRAWARRRLERLAEHDDGPHDDVGLALGLTWSLVSRWTSLVAEDSETSVAKRRARKGLLLRGSEQLLVLDGSRKTIGRGPSPDLDLGGARISRIHAEIVFEGAHFPPP